MSLEEQFDRWAADYDDAVRDETAYPFDGYSRVLSRVLELAAIQPGMEVLELGPGTGNLTARLLAAGAAVWAVDFSAEMIARARRKAPQTVFAKAGLMEDFPLDFQRPFARVVATYTLHELPLPDKLTLLQRLFAHHLAPDGFVVAGDIGFPDATARDAMRAQAGDNWDEEPFWIRDEVTVALRDVGLTIDWEQISGCGAVMTITNNRIHRHRKVPIT
jgi:putative AdoMet-dependent methyltransferase